MILRLELQVFLFDRIIDYLAFRGGDDDLFVQNLLFQFAKAGVEANGQCILPGDLQSVVFFGVMGCGNHHGSLETVLRGKVVDHRGGGESHVIHICARVGDAACEGVEHVVGGQPHIPAYQHLVGVQQRGQEEPELVDGLQIEIFAEDSAKVVCFECAHSSPKFMSGKGTFFWGTGSPSIQVLCSFFPLRRCCFLMILLQPAITLRRLFQRLLGGVLLVNLAAGDDALWRAVLPLHAHQGPALHLVGEVAVHQGQISVH